MTDRTTNRAQFPQTAAVVDMYTAAFGHGVRVKATEEGGRTVGTFTFGDPTPEQVKCDEIRRRQIAWEEWYAAYQVSDVGRRRVGKRGKR